ncbi:class II aldolase [Candidatus Gracilibacteria bacterium]|nr:class II aldolase [Candidatus Gracilibacteria bacterium]
MIKNLLQISRDVASSFELVQGAGGNTSVKCDDGRMWIKASGSLLSDLNEEKGFTVLDYGKIVEHFCGGFVFKANDHDLEDETNAFIHTLANGMSKPSMETSMHAFLGKYVVHTHAIYLNVLLCSKGGEDRTRNVFARKFDGLHWVDYVNPGYNLGIAIADLNLNVRDLNVIFLANHGLIVSGDSLGAVLGLSKEINDIAASDLNLRIEMDDLETVEEDLYFSRNKLFFQFDDAWLKKNLSRSIFPDFVVYCLGKIAFCDSLEELKGSCDKLIFCVKGEGVYYRANRRKAQAMHELLFTQLFVISSVEAFGEVNFLDKNDENYITNMTMEKYRRSRV